jgi:PAS domain S-box-containing protein
MPEERMGDDVFAEVRRLIDEFERIEASDRAAANGILGPLLRALQAVVDELRRREMTLLARQRAFESERQQALDPSEERFVNAFAHAPIGMALVGSDGRTFQVNQALCEMFGCSETEMLSGAIVDLGDAREIDLAMSSSRQLLRGERRSYQMEKRFRCPNGRMVDALLSVSVVRGRAKAPPYFICQLVDISERKRAEAQLRTSEERFRALIENAFDVVSLLDANGKLLYNSPNVTRVFGYDPVAAVGRVVVVDGVHPEDLERAQRQFLEALHHPGRPVRSEHRVRRADGAWIWVEGTACNMLDNPHVQAIVVNSRDVTERKRAEEAARQRQAELAQVLRAHTMGEIAAGLAHEINQPLAAIVNYARGCVRRLERHPAAAEIRGALDQITEEGLRAGRIVHGLRQFLRKEPAHHAWEDLNALVSESVRLVEADARQQGVAITTTLAGEIPSVRVDRVQIEQVIVNLIRNGLEAMTGRNETRCEIAVSTAMADGDAVTVAVSDRGGGLPDDMSERIFEPFFTTKPNGLGMGLSISRSIISAHGGRIWTAPNPHGGLTVSFFLPSGNGESAE